MKIKHGVRINGVSPEIAVAMQISDDVFKELGYKGMTVTSICDGKHMEGSKHYTGEAFDVRTRIFNDGQISSIAAALRNALGKEFDVVIEMSHIHVEIDV